jgi:hypothetical protein
MSSYKKVKKAVLEIGQKVRVNAKHWSRANQTGEVVGYNETGTTCLIKFDVKGVGFNDGWNLYLDERYLSKVENP